MGNRMPGLEKNMREFIVENLTNTEALSVTVREYETFSVK